MSVNNKYKSVTKFDGNKQQTTSQQTTKPENLKDSLKFTLGNVRTLPLWLETFSDGDIFFNK